MKWLGRLFKSSQSWSSERGLGHALVKRGGKTCSTGIKTFFFKGVTLPSSGSERNFFLRVLLFLLKKKLPVLIQPNYF